MTVTSLEYIQNKADDDALESQHDIFMNDWSRGRWELKLKSSDGTWLVPTYFKGRQFISMVKGDSHLMAYITHCITSHGSPGIYYKWFKIKNANLSCMCRKKVSSHKHIFTDCNCVSNQYVDPPKTLARLVSFLKKNR